MKGVVFTEFLEMVDDRFGIETVERIIGESELASGGAYTAVGTYDHLELIQLVQQLAEATDTSTADLLKTYGQHLFGRFVVGYPSHFEGVEDTLEFLTTLENNIHVEVRKLYPDAELPRFEHRFLKDGGLELMYRSPRPLADLAEGLLRGCIDHFGNGRNLSREDLSAEDGTVVRFRLH